MRGPPIGRRLSMSLAIPLMVVPIALPALGEESATSDAHHRAAPVRRLPPDQLGLTGEEAHTATLYRTVLPAVVTIATSARIPTATGSEKQSGLGSGVLISARGHILTAAHVVEGADAILVKTHDDRTHLAELMFSESAADIALLRLKDPPPNLSPAVLGDSDRLAVGQRTLAIGTPFGLERSLSVGHISAFRDLGRLYDGTIRAEMIQTDAAINSGNSGGPVFNSRGEIIGIASRILTVSGGFQGLGFAITINTARQLMALEDRPWIGIEGLFLDREQLGRLFQLDQEGGLLLLRVSPGSPADRAGLRGGTIPARILGEDVLLGGDLILEIGEQEACHRECLTHAHENISTMQTIPVTFLRNGRRQTVVLDVSQSRRSALGN